METAFSVSFGVSILGVLRLVGTRDGSLVSLALNGLGVAPARFVVLGLLVLRATFFSLLLLLFVAIVCGRWLIGFRGGVIGAFSQVFEDEACVGRIIRARKSSLT